VTAADRFAEAPPQQSWGAPNFLARQHCYLHHRNPATLPPKMEDGIDRNADEKMEFSTSKEVTVAPTFEAMHLKENLLRGIYAYGYESPSAVQSRAIVQVCKGRDTIAQAQSGTGKTATVSISILQVIDTAVRETQGRIYGSDV
jgi:superfamily II DNA/RNA helicase